MARRNASAAKRATNVSVRVDLLAAAREAGVNLSATL
jgi:post-segregation antitoxin (ccd killing protein)